MLGALAALLASKVYYFLGEYDEALSLTLGAGNAFEAANRVYGAEEYAETLVREWHSTNIVAPKKKSYFCVAKTIDRYIELESEEPNGKQSNIDPCSCRKGGVRLRIWIKLNIYVCFNSGYDQAFPVIDNTTMLYQLAQQFNQIYMSNLRSACYRYHRYSEGGTE